MKSQHGDRSVKHWETRPEAAWKGFRFNPPYEQGLSRLQEEVLGKTNFDPSTLWQWGTMQAMAVIEILKTVEKKFGREGQQAVLESLYRVGYDVGRQATEGTSIPEDMTTAEWMSFYATVMNRLAYASLESPQVVNDKLINFHIDWCPHQDHYRPWTAGSRDIRAGHAGRRHGVLEEPGAGSHLGSGGQCNDSRRQRNVLFRDRTRQSGCAAEMDRIYPASGKEGPGNC